MDLKLYVISNTEASYGASAILYGGVLEKVREAIGGDFFLLPASIHEMFAVRCAVEDEESYAKRLYDVVYETNRESWAIPEEDVLADAVYKYGAGGLAMVEPHQEYGMAS